MDLARDLPSSLSIDVDDLFGPHPWEGAGRLMGPGAGKTDAEGPSIALLTPEDSGIG